MTAPGGWPCSRTRGGLRRSAGAASCPGSAPRRPPPWAFALRRAAAAWCGGFPRARRARLLLCAPALPPCRVRGHAPPGARRAPRALEDVEKVLTDTAALACGTGSALAAALALGHWGTTAPHISRPITLGHLVHLVSKTEGIWCGAPGIRLRVMVDASTISWT